MSVESNIDALGIVTGIADHIMWKDGYYRSIALFTLFFRLR